MLLCCAPGDQWPESSLGRCRPRHPCPRLRRHRHRVVELEVEGQILDLLAHDGQRHARALGGAGEDIDDVVRRRLGLEGRGEVDAWVSEPDRGIYDAMNRGVAAARGEWILFLGADDRLVGDMVLSEAVNWMKKTEAGVAAGEAAIGLAIVVVYFRNRGTIAVEDIHLMKG